MICVAAGLATMLLINQLFVFSDLSKALVSFNAIFQFIWLVTFVIFFVMSRDGHRQYIVETLFFYATIYTVAYSFVALCYQAGILSQDFLKPLIMEDLERGQRLFNYSSATAFAWFGWLCRARYRPNLTTISMVMICGLSVYLTLSRVFILFLVIISFAFLFRLALVYVKVICLSALWSLSAISLYGFFDGSWNPFELFAGDSSGSFRMMEYNVARYLLWQNPLFGLGIAPTAADAWRLINQEFFAAGDLGVIGVWFDFGLIGLLLFFIGSHICCRHISGVSQGYALPLRLTGCLLAGYGCIAPVIFYAAGATYFAVLLGLWFDRRSPMRQAVHYVTPRRRLHLARLDKAADAHAKSS